MSEKTEIERLKPELARRALEEINEIPEQIVRNITLLREMVEAEANLKSRTDDAFLLRFLRSCKHDVDWAFQTIRKFYLTKANFPEMYSNFRPSAMLRMFNQNTHIILPGRDNLGRRVLLMRFGRWDPSITSSKEFFICIQMCLESIIDEEETQICGVVILMDVQFFGLRHAAHATPSILKQCASFVQEFYPARFLELHFVNEPSIFRPILLLFRSLLRKEIGNRMQFHGGNFESLHSYIPREILPEELGGSNPPTDNSAFVKSLLQRDDEIADPIENYGYLKARR